MVNCSSCGRPMEKVPDWMQGIPVQFACNNCPARQTTNIAFVNLEPTLPVASKIDEPDVDPEEIADDEPQD